MNISVCEKCYNCGLCQNICPVSAINIDVSGIFYKPIIDSQKCIDCGLCYERCPSNHKFPLSIPIGAYAGWHNDSQIVYHSSSGGVFYGLAQSILLEGGVVFGAIYTDDCKEVIFASTDETELLKLQKSKYVESLVGDCFKRIKAFLNQGRKVLFCGTPCQCAGLTLFLGKAYDGLIICDFACGGLPSHLMFQHYITWLERKYGAKICNVDFRPKTYGWRRYAVLAKFCNGKRYDRLGTEDPFLRSFLYGKYTVRNCCLNCDFADCHTSDITIADFWLNEQYTSLRNPDGISLILCNTQKGRTAVDGIRGEYYLEEQDPLKVAYHYTKTATTDSERARHDCYIETFKQRGFISAYQSVFPSSLKNLLINWMRRLWRRRR